MLGLNRLYITLLSPLILGEGDRITVTGRMGKDGEIIAGSIQISRDFDSMSYPPMGSGHAMGGIPTTGIGINKIIQMMP